MGLFHSFDLSGGRPLCFASLIFSLASTGKWSLGKSVCELLSTFLAMFLLRWLAITASSSAYLCGEYGGPVALQSDRVIFFFRRILRRVSSCAHDLWLLVW